MRKSIEIFGIALHTGFIKELDGLFEKCVDSVMLGGNPSCDLTMPPK
jgi:hypothetical protein